MRLWACAALLAATLTGQQTAPAADRDADPFDAALDAQDAPDTVFRVVLRFIPSMTPRTQFRITQRRNAPAEVEVCREEAANTRANTRSGQRQPDPLRVACKRGALPAERAAAWYAELVAGTADLLSRIQEENAEYERTGRQKVTLDGTLAEIHIRNGDADFLWRVYACESHTTATQPGAPPLCATLGTIAADLLARTGSE